ncbi:LutC/YkgG family protein [Oceanobacillus halotolerans]|uniref:LutC/YkgG family protein n=1 Tax=Oceanobacillus halotolerans TaxID=2663380 RepID=UPI0013DB47B7|nr:lactate utilization protein C [Oceanobacillus halotolerans]
MTIHNREAFLDRLAGELGRPRRTEGVQRPTWSVKPQEEVLAGLPQEKLVSVLHNHCAVIHTDFRRTTKEQLQRVLQETLEGYQATSIVASSDERNVTYGLDQFYRKLKANGSEVHLWDEIQEEENKTFAERADVGITFSDVTLAESGTVVLFNNKYNGRLISLLPKSYIAIIPKETIVPRMTQATKQIHEANQRGDAVSSCVSFVTGPSNSADIEMNLIVGVHGPINVTYIVVD